MSRDVIFEEDKAKNCENVKDTEKVRLMLEEEEVPQQNQLPSNEVSSPQSLARSSPTSSRDFHLHQYRPLKKAKKDEKLER